MDYHFVRETNSIGQLYLKAEFGKDAPENARFLNDFIRADVNIEFYEKTLLSLLDSVGIGDVFHVNFCVGPFDVEIEDGVVTIDDIESGLDWNHVSLPVNELSEFISTWLQLKASFALR